MFPSSAQRFLTRLRVRKVFSRSPPDLTKPVVDHTIENVYKFPHLLRPPFLYTNSRYEHPRFPAFGKLRFPFYQVHESIWIAPTALVAGNVMILSNTSIWDRCIIKGDINSIDIGSMTNIQEGTVITEAFEPLRWNHDGSTYIGNFVSIGPRSQLRACTIESYCVIGAACVISEGAFIEQGAALGPGTFVPPDFQIPRYQVDHIPLFLFVCLSACFSPSVLGSQQLLSA